MRQVFSSPRLENVEKLAELLREADIEVRITDGRSYQGSRRKRFSYGDSEGSRPALWVVRSEDQVKARAILREAGLLDSTRPGSFAGPSFRMEPPPTPQAVSRKKRAFRVKLFLLAGISVVLALMMSHIINYEPPQQLASPPFDGTAAPTLLPVARAVFASEIPAARIPIVCLAVDGKDAPQPMIEALSSDAVAVVPASYCVRVADEDRGSYHRASGREAMLLDVHGFRASSPELAQVQFSAYHHRLFGSYKTLEVRRVDEKWQVTRVLRHVAS
ncbi:hypothetical protein [Lysobacter sp. D1-1-M9]|uniref:hypothetical protein n=2 Tax=Novilysobacter TaxID=3382699 RepID=UPI002FCB2D16